MTRTERSYYVVFAGYALAQFFIAPVYPLFLLSRGLDLFQVNVVLAVYLVTVFTFEVPTGAVADRFGRKVSFLLACAIRMVAYGLYAFAEDFGDCLLAEFIDAVGTTLASGALEAWVVDGVRAEGDRRPTDALFARAQVIGRAAMIGGGIACGYLAEIDWAIPWLVCVAIFAATAVAGALAMREPPAAARPEGASLVRSMMGGLAAVAASPFLLAVCLLFFVGAFAGFPVHMLWQTRVETLAGAGLWRMGWITAALNLAALAGSALLPRLLRRARREAVLFAAALWRSVMLGLFASAGQVRPALAGLLLQEVASGLSDPVYAAWTNEHIAAPQRATVLSVRSTFFTLGGACGLVALGLVARAHGVPLALAAAAAVFLATAPAILLLGRIAHVAAREAPLEPAEVPAAKVGPTAVG